MCETKHNSQLFSLNSFTYSIDVLMRNYEAVFMSRDKSSQSGRQLSPASMVPALPWQRLRVPKHVNQVRRPLPSQVQLCSSIYQPSRVILSQSRTLLLSSAYFHSVLLFFFITLTSSQIWITLTWIIPKWTTLAIWAMVVMAWTICAA